MFSTSCLNNLILVIDLGSSEGEFQALEAVYTVDFNNRYKSFEDMNVTIFDYPYS